MIFSFLVCATSAQEFHNLELIETSIGKSERDERETHIEVPQFLDLCIYDQKCGVFLSHSFKALGPLRGFFLSIDRRFRCNGLTKSQALPVRFNQEGHLIDHAEDYKRKGS